MEIGAIWRINTHKLCKLAEIERIQTIPANESQPRSLCAQIIEVDGHKLLRINTLSIRLGDSVHFDRFYCQNRNSYNEGTGHKQFAISHGESKRCTLFPAAADSPG